MRALVVEDDESVARLNARLLQNEGFEVDTASTAGDGERLALAHNYDLVMLDMGLPDRSGAHVLEVIREKSRTIPVLIVSGAGNIEATVNALDAGADDYLLKPYRPAELSARVRALMRRIKATASRESACGNVTLDGSLRDARIADTRLNLTAKEFVLLEYFVAHRDKTLTRRELLEDVWRFDFDPGTNMVDVNVSRLRTKLINAGASCRVDSERGVGYVFREHLAKQGQEPN